MTNDDRGLVVAVVGGAVAEHLDMCADRRHTWIVCLHKLTFRTRRLLTSPLRGRQPRGTLEAIAEAVARRHTEHVAPLRRTEHSQRRRRLVGGAAERPLRPSAQLSAACRSSRGMPAAAS